MNGFIRAASYLRVSSQQQAQQHTIDSQQMEVLARSVRDNTPVDPGFEYIDDGYSGAELLRPALERLRDHIAASMIDRLYVHSPDRLARKFSHQAILLEEINKYGCEVIFLNQDGLPDSPETKMLIQMQGMFAEYEREKILERTRRGRRHSASNGNVSVFGRAPYGYRYIRKSASEKETRWEIDPAESEAVRLMFELVVEHQYSLAAVCRELRSRNILTRTGKQHWNNSTVRGILINPAYSGEAMYGKQRLVPRKPGRRAKRGDPVVPRQAKVTVANPLSEQIKIAVPALVSKSLFEEARIRMDENRKHQRARRGGAKHLLSGLLVCGKCGSAYCHQGGKKYHYYRCIGTDTYRRDGKAICDNSSVKGGALESRVWLDVCNLLREPERLSEEMHRRQSDAPEHSTVVSKQQSLVNELRARLDRMIDAFAQGLIERSEFESRITSLRAQHDREAAALASLLGEHIEATDPAAVVSVLVSLADQVEQRLETASHELKRELMTLLIARIEICEDKIRIVYKVPPNPFRPSPDNRGIIQHWLSLPDVASRLRSIPRGVKRFAVSHPSFFLPTHFFAQLPAAQEKLFLLKLRTRK